MIVASLFTEMLEILGVVALIGLLLLALPLIISIIVSLARVARGGPLILPFEGDAGATSAATLLAQEFDAVAGGLQTIYEQATPLHDSTRGLCPTMRLRVRPNTFPIGRTWQQVCLDV